MAYNLGFFMNLVLEYLMGRLERKAYLELLENEHEDNL